MITNTHHITIVIAIIFLITACDRTEDDILQLMPGNTQLLFENDYVRVLNVTLEPGEAQPLHECGNRFIYALGDYTINYYQPHDTLEIPWNEGGVHWHERGMHAVENAGETVADYLVIERKEKNLPRVDESLHEMDPVIIETGFVTEVFENDHARVSRVDLPPGESIPDHQGTHRLIFAMSDFEVRYTSESEETVERTFSKKDFHWHPAGTHAVENTGDTNAEFVIFTYIQ